MVTVSITHSKVSAITSIPSPTGLVTPTDWNDQHVVTGLGGVPSVATPVVVDNVPTFSDTAGDLQDSVILSVPTARSKAYLGIGDNVAYAASTTGATKIPLVITARLANWTLINDQTFSDWTLLAPIDSTSNLYASFATNLRTSTTFNFGHLAAFEDLMIHAGSGVVTDQFSFLSLPTFSGPVTNRHGLNIAEAGGAGTITNNYGVHVRSLTRGTSTNLAVYTEGTTPSLLGGNLTIGVTIPAAGTVRTLALNGATSGASAGSGIFGNNANYAIGNASWLYGGAYSATLAFQSIDNNYRFGATSPVAGTVSTLQLNGATSGAGAGSGIFGNNANYAFGNGSWLNGGAYDPTLYFSSVNSLFKFVGSVSANGTGIGSIAPYVTTGITPTYGWYLASNGADQKIWDVTQNAAGLLFRAVNDANSAATNWMTVTRGAGTAVTSVVIPALSPTSLALTNAHIFVGNVSNNPADVAMSGDATISNTGALTLASTIVAGGPTGSATVAPIITYDAKGRLTTVTSATITPAIGNVTGLGTGVATALGTNVGSAGAPVTFNGAAGTPSSIVLTNATGFPFATGGTGITQRANGGTGTSTGAVVVVKQQKFTGSGTYTPSTGLLYAIIECVGSGGGGGAVAGTAARLFAGGGGGSGGYSRTVASAATIGASQVVTIGAAGAGGAAGSNSGTAGADVSVGSICIGKGGGAGTFSDSGTLGSAGAGGVAGTGDLAAAGTPGGGGIFTNAGNTLSMGSLPGGSSFFGGGGAGAQGAGTNAGAFGSGGSGGSISIAANAAGGNGSAGVVFITEYTNQ